MKTYRILARPDIRKAVAGRPALSEELIAGAIRDVVIRELSEDSFGRVFVDVRLERPNHEEALNEIARVVEQSGYALFETMVTEWISAAAQRAAIAGATFLLGDRAAKNPIVGLAVSAGATLIAEQTGWLVDQVLVEYAASRDLSGDWTLTRIPRVAAADEQGKAGFASA
jgi:hypothetical protein